MQAVIAERIAVVGLGYVGLPVAVAFARAAEAVVGFDVSAERVAALREGHDWTGEIADDELAASRLTVSDDPVALAGASFFVVTVPTPVDDARRPDFGPLIEACRTIGPHLSKGAVVVFESTVYPGATEEVCAPVLEAASGLACGTDFTLGYSPERINPGDRAHRLETIVKVVAAQDAATLARVSAAYGAIVAAGIHQAPSIRVAEAAKVIENTQRDINIALMNELALIFDRLGLRTRDVLDAAGTKWNFLNFTPGLVGGHCIGVDPYYLTAKAEETGYHPQVILSGRRINDSMGSFVAQKAVKLMVRAGTDLSRPRLALLGLTFKENVPDLRNSRAPDIIRELKALGISPMISDAEASPRSVREQFGHYMDRLEEMHELDALILAVPHRAYIADRPRLERLLRRQGVFMDLKSAFSPAEMRPDLLYWSL